MIVLETKQGWRCVTQPDHARLSHDVLKLWRSDGLPDHPRRADLLLAVREHDNGWQEADSAPRLDPSRPAPIDFTRLPPPERREIWRRGIERHRDTQPYVSALVAEHARHLSAAADSERFEDPEWGDFLAELVSERDLRALDAEIDLPSLLADYRWLHIADLVSLALCAGWERPFERWGVQGQVSGNTVVLDPFPLAGATRFSVPCRHLEAADHASDAEMATALATCRWQEFTVRISP